MDLGTIVAGLLTLAILTFLYRDNPVYKLAEYLLVCVSVGYALVIAWRSTLVDLLFEPLFGKGDWSLLVPLFLGLLVFGLFHHKTNSLSRIPFAVLIGSLSALRRRALWTRTVLGGEQHAVMEPAKDFWFRGLWNVHAHMLVNQHPDIDLDSDALYSLWGEILSAQDHAGSAHVQRVWALYARPRPG